MVKENKKILAIITARGGSKGIPGKNIKLLAGKPLIAYSIEAAKQSKYIDRIVVSTDDSDIAKVARDFGAEVVDRPADLAQDSSPTAPALKQVVKFLEDSEGYIPDLVLLLQPTSPLRTANHINEIIEKFKTGDYDSMLSVKFLYKPRFEIMADDRIEPVEKNRLTRQQRPPLVLENGALYIIDISLVRNGQITGSKIGYYQMDEASSIDIDEPFDFVIAEQLVLNNK